MQKNPESNCECSAPLTEKLQKHRVGEDMELKQQTEPKQLGAARGMLGGTRVRVS